MRKHLSAIKGGRLAAAAAPARVVTLAISDVPGDDPATIGSGPTVPDRSTWEEVRALDARYGLGLPRLDGTETPKPGEIAPDLRMIATPLMALEAAAETAREHGLAPLILGDALEGESREMGTVMAGIALGRAAPAPPARPLRAAVGGRGHGDDRRGARRGVAGGTPSSCSRSRWRCAGRPGSGRLAGDTDGIDGTEDAAGAVIAPDTLARARAAGLDAKAALRGHDSYTLFDCARRFGPHRPDAHQRQRLARHPHR